MAGYPGSQLAFEDEEHRIIGCISTIVGIAGTLREAATLRERFANASTIPAPAFKHLDNTKQIYMLP
ncbi:hypothetical protein NIES22_42540 [Calothrix brevissima NIES-22]|nr:hypothetical protein NIES22_42540 [Calothrix brevissima NIES-22]